MSIKYLAKFPPTKIYPQEMKKHFLISLFGIILTLFSSFFLIEAFSWNYLLAYVTGVCLNILVSFFLRKIFLTPFLHLLQIRYHQLLAAHAVLSMFNVAFVYLCVAYLQWDDFLSIVGVVLISSAVNFIVAGLWCFINLPPEEVFYEAVDGQFYDDMVNPARVGCFRAWMHRSRFAMTKKCVESYYKPGMTIIDFACGSCSWNQNGLPVTGLDVNKNLLDYGVQQGRLKNYDVGDMYNSPFSAH